MPQRRASSLLVLTDTGGPTYHVGDEAMLEANLARVRGTGHEIDLRVVGREASPEGLRRAVADVDGVWCSGGGNLSSSWPALLDQRVAVLRAAAEHGVPAVVTGQTIGPDLDADSRASLGAALSDARLVGVRELPSAALAVALGVPVERVVLQVDDAFDLADRAPDDAALVAAADRPHVSVTLDGSFATTASQPVVRRIAEDVADLALAEGLSVVVVPHEGPLHEVGDLDGAAGRALREHLVARGVDCTVAPVLEPREAAWLTRRAALVVSSRYHPIVFATAAAVPCLALHRDRYTRIKLEGALAHVGLAGRSVGVEAIRLGSLAGALRDAWDARRSLASAMHHARPALLVQEERRWGHVAAALGLDAGTPAGEQVRWPTDVLARAAVSALPRTADPAERSPSTPDDDDRWAAFARDGFLRLGPLLSPAEVDALCRRADEYALGTRVDDRMQMQLDTGGDYDALPDAVDAFDEGTHLYRKIQGLESDDLFAALVEHPVCLDVCAHLYGPHAPLSIFRAMIMNKPAGQGTVLPWHQDGGDVWALDRDPLVTVWVALDPATTANGCLEVVPGSHALGLLTDRGSTLSEEDARRHCPPDRRMPLEVEPGHGVLLHNWLIHRSGVNPSPRARRAFTTCYLDGRTISTLTGDHFPPVPGSRAIAPYRFVEEMDGDRTALRATFAEAERYARSLEAEVERLRGLGRADGGDRAGATPGARDVGATVRRALAGVARRAGR